MNKTEAKKQLQKPLDLNRLSKMQARVEIIKDVIAAIKLGKMSAGVGYFHTAVGRSAKYPKDLRTLLGQENQHCYVCAIGAAFASVVGRVNGFNISKNESLLGLVHGQLIEKLADFWSAAELRGLESAFEGDYYNPLSPEHKFWLETGGCEDERMESRTDRLITIAENIIKNNGEFCP